MENNKSNQIKSNSIILYFIALVLSAISLFAEAAVSFSVLHDFIGADGGTPNGFLAQGRDGWLYGTTQGGIVGVGTGGGVAFKIKPDGTSYTIIHKFIQGSDEGSKPVGGLSLGRDGSFYGVTATNAKQPNGGYTGGAGAIFKMTPSGVVTTLHTFSFVTTTDPRTALSAPTEGPDGNLYGTTWQGGNSNVGIIYKLNPSTKLFTILYHFKNDHIDGIRPRASLIVGTDGKLYGTTSLGGRVSVQPDISNNGTVFKINPDGTGYQVIYNFDFTHGTELYGQLLQGSDGNFYGTTRRGGTGFYGTAFKLTLQGNITTLKNFGSSASSADGALPTSGLVRGSDGNFYGTTNRGGSDGWGVVFQLTPQGNYSVQHSFKRDTDGSLDMNDNDNLTLHTNGMLYGAAKRLGPIASSTLVNGPVGTLFRLNMGSRAFVKPDIDMAKAGVVIGLYGDLAGTTNVTFNGVAASFAQVSANFITVRVPPGAATGSIKVFKGTIQVDSLKNFLVLPTFTGFSPASGAVGRSIILTGISLSQVSSIRFGNIVVPLTQISVDNDSQLTVNVPIGAVTGKITIITKGGSAISATNFTVTP